MKHFAFILCLALTVLTSCARREYPLNYSSFETKVIASRVNDVYTLRVEGRDATRRMAEDQACKQAVHDIIFKNLYKNFGDHGMLRALANDPSIEQAHQQYFSNFFADGGEYERYLSDTRFERETSRTDVQTVVLINVAVDRGALRQKLIYDGILK